VRTDIDFGSLSSLFDIDAPADLTRPADLTPPAAVTETPAATQSVETAPGTPPERSVPGLFDAAPAAPTETTAAQAAAPAVRGLFDVDPIDEIATPEEPLPAEEAVTVVVSETAAAPAADPAAKPAPSSSGAAHEVRSDVDIHSLGSLFDF
jgi:hypothetical protein